MKDLHKYLTKIPRFIKLPRLPVPILNPSCVYSPTEEFIIINIEKISCIVKIFESSVRIYMDAGDKALNNIEIDLSMDEVQKIIEMAHENIYYKG